MARSQITFSSFVNIESFIKRLLAPCKIEKKRKNPYESERNNQRT